MCDSIACSNLPIYLQNVKLIFDADTIIPYYTTVGLVPSNEKIKRVWTFTAAFHRNRRKPNTPISITYDFNAVQFEGTASFESPIFGNLQTKNYIYNAGQYIEYTYNKEEKFIVFVIQLPCDTSQFSFQFEIFDQVDPCWFYECGNKCTDGNGCKCNNPSVGAAYCSPKDE